MDNFFEIIVVYAGITLLEMILGMRWNKKYFSFGFTLFFERIETYDALDAEEVSIDALAQTVSSAWGQAMAFECVDKETILFREKYFEFASFQYNPIMNGSIEFDNRSNEIRVRGKNRWATFAFIIGFIMMVATSFPFSGFIFYIFPLALIVVPFFIQRSKYKKIALFLKESFESLDNKVFGE